MAIHNPYEQSSRTRQLKEEIALNRREIITLREQSGRDDHEIATLRKQIREDHTAKREQHETIARQIDIIAARDAIIEAFVYVAKAGKK